MGIRLIQLSTELKVEAELGKILNDDACHLNFSKNGKRANKNKFTRFLASFSKHVDNLHHVDPWCHKLLLMMTTTRHPKLLRILKTYWLSQ